MIYTKTKNKYTIIKNPSKSECSMFRQFVRRAMKSFAYNYDTSFLQTIKVDKDPYLFKYDQPKNFSLDKYSQELEELALEANKQIDTSGKFEAYKIDLYGQWDKGKIIILRDNSKTSRNKAAKELFKLSKKYLYL